MNDNAQQSTCPVRGLTLAGQALVNKLKEEHSLFIKETVEFFMANDISTLDDVLNLTEEALMNKILKQLNTLKTYIFENLYVEFMKYKEATQSKSTVNAYIKAYKRFYMNDPIIKEDLSKIAVPTLRIWLQKIIDEYKLNFLTESMYAV